MLGKSPLIEDDTLQQKNTQAIAPNIFYDIIVFLTPTITFFLGITVGIHTWLFDYAWPKITIKSQDIIIVSILLFFGSYEFGRIAETYSDIFIAKPIKWLHRHNIIFQNHDYNMDLSSQIDIIGIPKNYYFGRTSSKWTLFFFALEFIPNIGSDLLKRYAWEKLARSSAFTMLLLFLISMSIQIYAFFLKCTPHSWNFGSTQYTITSIILYTIWSFDYYKRNCWNNDLLVTTTPVIISVVRDLNCTSSQS